MRNHIIHIYIATLVALMALVGFNWLVDPAHLFSHGKYEMGIAHQLNKGKFIAGVTNYDERLLQLYRLQDLQNPQQTRSSLPDTIVIGSSRSMQIHSGTGVNALNLSVSGASIEDYIAILQLVDSLPFSRIIFSVDPWVFNRNNDQTRWHSICLAWRMGMKEILDQTASEVNCSENKWQQLVNLSYTMASAKIILSRVRKLEKPSGEWFEKADDTPEQELDLIRPDGSRVYNKIFAEIPADNVAAKAKGYGRPPVYALGDFLQLDEETKSLYEKLLHQLRQKKEVVIFLPPYHPNAYPSITDNVPIVKDVESYLRNISHKENVEIVGSYDPSKVGCVQEEFFDGMHPKEACVKKIIATIHSNPHRAQ